MKVQGIEITQEQIDACLARMKATEYFRLYEIVSAASRAGVTSMDAANRLGDRLIQRERKAGRIIPANRSGLWRHTGSSDNGDGNAHP